MTESSKKNETENKADPEKNVKFEFSVMENGGKNSYVVTVSWCNRRLADDVVRASMVTYCVKELGGQLSENSVSVLSDETIEKIRLIGTRADADALASALMVKAPTADTSRGTVKIFNDLVTKVGEKVKTNGECDHEKIFDTYVKKASDSVKETARKILDHGLERTDQPLKAGQHSLRKTCLPFQRELALQRCSKLLRMRT